MVIEINKQTEGNPSPNTLRNLQSTLQENSFQNKNSSSPQSSSLSFSLIMDDQKCQNPSTSNLIDQQQLNNNNLIIKTNKDLINCFNKNSPEKQQNNENNKELFENLELCLCSNCGLPIEDRFLYKVLDSQFYHEKCLNCSVCRQSFPSGTCFSRNSLLFCREHFLNNFGPKCSRCAAPIDERSIVRRANQHIYHLECFQCVVCKREMNTGDQFYLIPMDGRLVCRQDFETAQKESAEMDLGNKRPRTTISAKSLEMLKHAYQCSNKPARHIREQLASQTGLDMRVVQVWFQNRRAKEKRLKKDTHRRYLSNNPNDQHSPDCFSIDMRSTSNGGGGGCGSGPSSVPSSIGLQNLFGRNGTIDSDSGASNNDAESPIYSIYTNPSEVDVDGSGEFCQDPQTTIDGGEQQRQQHYHNQQLNVDSFPTGISKTPQPPQQQHFSFEQQLNISTNQHSLSQPSTPQQLNNSNQLINVFSPPITSINCSQPSQAALLAEQQYLLAAAAFGAPTQPIQINQPSPFLMVGSIQQQQQQFPPTSEFYQQNFNGINLPSTTQNMMIQFSPLQMHPSHYNPITQ